VQITYLTELNNYPTVKVNSSLIEQLKPTPADEIISLENTYNNGQLFPKALRELLYIAGEYCYVFDYGLNDTQTELQADVRENLVDFNLSIVRPFYAVDIYGYGSTFLFVYLDEDAEDPIIYEGAYGGDPRGWLHSLNATLSQFVNARLKRFLSGENPF
jgi:hypothetical protein